MYLFIKKNVQKIYEILFIVLISFTPLLWFSPQKMVIGLDSGYPIDFIGYFLQRSFTWLSSVDFGVNMATYVGLLPFHGLQALLSYLHVPFYSVEKVTFVFWFFIIAFSMYLLINYLYPQKNFWILRLSVVVFYVYNLYIFSFWINGEQTTFSAYSLLPILVLILLKFLRKEITILRASLYLNIAFFLLSAGAITGVPLLGSSAISILTLIVLWIITTKKDALFLELKRLLILIVYSSIIFVFLNAYWILPFVAFFKHQFEVTFAVNGGSVGANISWVNFISEHSSYINLFRLQGDINWYNHPGFYSNNYFLNPLLIIGSFLFPIFAYLSLLLVKDKKEKFIVIFLVVLSLLGILLSAGSHNPFGYIYVFMMNNIPGFVAFRSAYYKFVIILYFSFSVLIGISIYYLFEKFIKKKLHIYLWTLLMCALLLYNYPFFQKQNYIINKPFSTMMKVPQYVFNFKSFEDTHSNSYRTLVVPPESNSYPLNLYNWGYYGASSLFSLLSHNTFLYDKAQLSSDERSLGNKTYSLLANKKYDEFLRMAELLNIHEVLLTQDVVTNYGSSPMEPPAVYKNAIESSHLFSVMWHDGPWTLYELDNASSSEISAENRLSIYNGDASGLASILPMSNTVVISSPSQGSDTSGIPASEIINKNTCVSCQIFIGEVEPGAQTSLINPGSFLYSIKRWKENLSLAKVKTNDEKTQLLLELSLKRMSELSNIAIYSARNAKVIDWEPITDALSYYFTNLNKLTKVYIRQHNFSELKLIDSYVFTLIKNSNEIYNSKYAQDADFNNAFTVDLWQQQEIAQQINNAFHDYILQKSFTYSVGGLSPEGVISIPMSSLPKDLDNNIELPTAYDADGQPVSLSINLQDKQLFISGIPSNSHYLTLRFNMPFNYVAHAKPTTIALPNKAQTCLSVPISHYSWENTYLITINKSEFIDNPIDLYITAQYPTLMDSNNGNSGYLHYETKYQYYLNYPANAFILFPGNQNYTGATIYACSDNPAEDMKKLASNMNISKLAQPQLFSETVHSITDDKKLPNVSFEKINPTEYKVNVAGADSPYLLTFLEKYSDLWKVYDSRSHEINAQHVLVDGYANGWYISKAGKYSLYIRFLPQKFFILGLRTTFISTIVLVLLVAVLIKLKKI